MKIAFLTEYYHPFEVGGAERSARRLAEALVGAGHSLTVFTPNYGARPREFESGVAIRRLAFPQRLAPGALARRWWLANPVLQVAYALMIAAALRRHEILHVQNSTFVVAGALASLLSARPMTLTIRDLGYLPAVRTGEPSGSIKARLDAAVQPLERALKRLAARRACVRIFVSDALREHYRAAGTGLDAGSRVIPNIGPAVQGHWRPGTGRRVLFVGKLSTGKGAPVLLAAARRVRARFPDAEFLLAGSPGVGWSETGAAGEGVRRLGRLSGAQVLELMRECQVFVSPSTWPEPLSRSVLEAMAIGMPIVATRVGGTGELIEHNRSGLLVPPGDPASLAEAIERVLTSPTLGRELGRGARERFSQRFTPERVLPAVLEAYSQAAPRRARGAGGDPHARESL